MKIDYLGSSLPPQQPPVTAADLPGGPQIDEAQRQAMEIHTSLDMIRLTPQERDRFGTPSTPEEMKLNRLFAEFCDRFPFALGFIGREPGTMRSSYEMESALGFYRQSNAVLLRVAQGALVIVGAALTEKNDRVEEVARALVRDPHVPAGRQSAIGCAVQEVDEIRGAQGDIVQQQQSRKKHRSTRRQSELRAAGWRSEQQQLLGQMATAALPGPVEPAHRSHQKGKKGNTPARTGK